ncbi:bifunctional protein FolD-like [Octopus sinensis]|uniref:methenyltetrahydrofolate cyclohydrolase n=1 Tax=Octopus sinensis TaxID=2607531 RepID=A0A7E6EHY9_9MOLL|nr:bifunctional protein FolD-like [Octopus sinensis]
MIIVASKLSPQATVSIICNGFELAKQVNRQTKKLLEEAKHNPTLHIVQVGDNKASSLYINKKVSVCRNMDISLYGKNVTVVGHSPQLGMPIASILKSAGSFLFCSLGKANVTMLSSSCNLDDLKRHILGASVVVSVCGIPGLIRGVAPKCSFITPVPGGVGPVTVSMLVQNVVKLHIQKYY